MADYKTYDDICDDVCRAMGDLNQARIDEVKAVVNMVYLNEICGCDDVYPLYWLMDLIDDIKTKTRATITGITAANPGVFTAAAHGFAMGDIIQISDVAGMTELNERIFVVVYVGADSFTLKDLSGTAINTTNYTAYTSGGYAHHRGVTLSRNFRSIHSFNFRGYSQPIEPIGFEELEKSTEWYDTDTTAKPTRYLHKPYADTAGTEYQRLMWFTLPDTTYYARIWGEKIPSRLSAVTDVPVLPARFHDAIVSGSVARLTQYGEVQLEGAVVWPQLYKMHVQAIKEENRAWWKRNVPETRSPLYLP